MISLLEVYVGQYVVGIGIFKLEFDIFEPSDLQLLTDVIWLFNLVVVVGIEFIEQKKKFGF